MLERNARYLNTNPKGEPQLGKRGLYRGVGGGSPRGGRAALGAQPRPTGELDLLAIAERSGISVRRDPREAAGPSCSSSDLLVTPA